LQLLKEKKFMEERTAELTSKLTEEEDKAKHVGKQRSKFESQLQEVEDQLEKEKLVCPLFSSFPIFRITSLGSYLFNIIGI
jgi:hypothetical protein